MPYENISSVLSDADKTAVLAKLNEIKALLSDRVSAGLPGTLLGETQHSLASHCLRLFHLLLPVEKSSVR